MKWIDLQVEEIADLIRGVSYKKDQVSKVPKPDFIKLLRANNIDGELNEDDLQYVPRSIVSDDQVMRNGDILLAMSSGSKHLVGKSAISEINEERTFGAFCGLLRTKNGVCQGLISKALKSQDFRNYISDISSGTNINNLKREHVLGYRFRIPENNEDQQRLNCKIDSLFSEIDAGVEELKRTKEKLELYKQSVLNAAIRGKLVPQDPNDEPASTLLARIRAEKESLIKQGKQKKQKPLPPINPTEVPFDLPKGWEWVRVQDVMTLESGSPYEFQETGEEGVPYVKVGDMNDPRNLNSVQYSSTYFVRNDEVLENTVPLNSIIFPKRGGAIATNKRRYVLDTPILIDLNTMAMTVPSKLDFSFIRFWFETIDLASIGGDTVIPQINNKDIYPLLVPLPPIHEQRSIANIASECLHIGGAATESITSLERSAFILKQGILKAAFEGSLV